MIEISILLMHHILNVSKYELWSINYISKWWSIEVIVHYNHSIKNTSKTWKDPKANPKICDTLDSQFQNMQSIFQTLKIWILVTTGKFQMKPQPTWNHSSKNDNINDDNER